jgi:hypothetical protein
MAGSFYATTGPSYVGENPASSSNDGAITFVIDGAGLTLSPGVKLDIEIPFACTINSVTMLADQSGSAVLDIWKAPLASFPPTSGNSICGASRPTITSAQSVQDNALVGWTTTVSSGDTLRFNVVSATSITRLTVTLKITKG